MTSRKLEIGQEMSENEQNVSPIISFLITYFILMQWIINRHMRKPWPVFLSWYIFGISDVLVKGKGIRRKEKLRISRISRKMMKWAWIMNKWRFRFICSSLTTIEWIEGMVVITWKLSWDERRVYVHFPVPVILLALAARRNTLDKIYCVEFGVCTLMKFISWQYFPFDSPHIFS